MTQEAKVIDVALSYVPIDPNSLFPTLEFAKDDSRLEKKQIRAYDGFNFMPTAYGYRSYFGINSKLDFASLASRVDAAFVLQDQLFRNKIFALCEDGIWTKFGGQTGAWTHDLTLTVPAAGTHKEWTWTFIENSLFLYREGEAHLWKYAAPDFTFEELTPTFLNMAGQKGIFKASGRLGFWDALNSVSWSNLDNFADLTPSATTLAGNAKFQDVLGNIVTIRNFGEGFIIYSTKSITAIFRNYDSTLLWDAKPLLRDIGVAYPKDVTTANPDTRHFARTPAGFVEISGKDGIEFIVPEFFDFIKEQDSATYLRILEGRFLFFEMLSPDLLYGRVQFETSVIPETIISWGASAELTNLFMS